MKIQSHVGEAAIQRHLKKITKNPQKTRKINREFTKIKPKVKDYKIIATDYAMEKMKASKQRLLGFV